MKEGRMGEGEEGGRQGEGKRKEVRRGERGRKGSGSND